MAVGQRERGHCRAGAQTVKPVAAYTWHVAPGGVLIVVDLSLDGWRSVTNDAVGIVEELAELRPDIAYTVPCIVYRDSTGRWDGLGFRPSGTFDKFVAIGAATEAEAIAWVLAGHG